MKWLVSLSALFLVSACGLQKMPGKMDQTNNGLGQMSNKMDQTNDGIGGMSGKMDRTNTGLDDLKHKMDETNAGLAELKHQMDQTNNGLGQMGGKLDETNTGLSGLSGKMDKTNAGLDGLSGKMDKTNAGLDGLSGKMDKTNAGLSGLSGKMDQTNKGLGDMAGKLDDTNSKISSTNDSLLVMLDQLRKTNESMGQLNDGMQKTNSGVHNQILLLALDDMMKPDNTLSLTPPVAMMPAGKKFAEEATPEEVLELTYTWLHDVDQSIIDESSLKDKGYSEAAVKEMQAQLAHDKTAKIMGLSIINGFLPRATVDALVRHVVENGRYHDAALAALMFRVSFVDVFLLEGGVLSEKVAFYGQMVEAVDDVAKIDYLAGLPIASKIGVTNTLTGPMNFVPKDTLLPLYREIDRRFDSDLDPKYKPGASHDPEILTQAATLATLRAKVKERLAYWTAQP